ncbi:MAG: thiol reductant ABC exporter subunit CydC [bacterium]
MSDLLRLFKLFKPYLGVMLLGVLLALITVLANVALLAIAGWFITMMALAGAAGVSTDYFTPGALIRASAIARTAGRYGERIVTHEATFRLLAELRVWFYERIEPLAPAVLENYRSGDILSRLRADIDSLNNVYLRLFVPTTVALLASLIFIAVLALYDPWLAVAEFVLLSFAGIFVPWLVYRLGHQASRDVTVLKAQMRAHLVSDLQGMGELVVYGAAHDHAQNIQTQSLQLAKRQQRLAQLAGLSQGAVGFAANLAMWSMLIIAIPHVNAGEIARPELAMLAFLALASFEAVVPLPLAMQSLGETLAALRRIFDLVDQSPAVPEPEKPLTVPKTFALQFKDVGFTYPLHVTEHRQAPLNSDGSHHELNQAALSQINFQLPVGKSLAIIGASGSGKSTLVQLLLKFRAAQQGEVSINGQNLTQYASDDWRKRIAVVPQQTHLFNSTIAENLRLAHPQATQSELEHVCKLALLHDTIMQQPDQYETETGETGIKLSGGQAKRLAIARALLKPDTALLVLDEPSEGLDAATAEQVLQNVMQHCLTQQQSLLMISHRLQGLAAFDDIIVMDRGRIIESGNHQQLLDKKGYYANLI